LVEVDGEVLGEDDVIGVGGVESDSSHDGDEHVLFVVESTGVEGEAVALDGETFVGEDQSE
jgi:hypothetical protein